MDYAGLVAASKAYADRQDTEVDANIDTFIVLAEARINRLLKTRQQSARVHAVIETDRNYYGLPTDYAGVRQMELITFDPAEQVGAEICKIASVCNFNYLTPEMMTKFESEGIADTWYYTIESNKIHIWPIPTNTVDVNYAIELLYYQNVPNLNGTATTNWMSIDHPDIYIAGLCAEIELFAKNYKAADGWFDRMKTAIAELDNADELDRWSGAELVIRNV